MFSWSILDGITDRDNLLCVYDFLFIPTVEVANKPIIILYYDIIIHLARWRDILLLHSAISRHILFFSFHPYSSFHDQMYRNTIHL